MRGLFKKGGNMFLYHHCKKAMCRYIIEGLRCVIIRLSIYVHTAKF